MQRRIAVRALVLDDNGQLLCVRQKPYSDMTSTGNDWWCLPGGKLELGESLIDGVTREMIEETGVKPCVGNLLYVQQFTFKDEESLEFFFHITYAADYLHIDLSQTTHGELEIAEIAFVDPKSTTVLPKFLATEDLPAAAQRGVTSFFAAL
jgi:8-oxo-dGTP diphosphatase